MFVELGVQGHEKSLKMMMPSYIVKMIIFPGKVMGNKEDFVFCTLLFLWNLNNNNNNNLF